MAMMTDEAVADLLTAAPPTAGDSQDSQPSTSSQPRDAAPVIPLDVAAAVAGASSISASSCIYYRQFGDSCCSGFVPFAPVTGGRGRAGG
jgi:hypothetical protein